MEIENKHVKTVAAYGVVALIPVSVIIIPMLVEWSRENIGIGRIALVMLAGLWVAWIYYGTQ